MSILSNFIKKAAPIVAQFSPEPISRTAATAITIGQQQQDNKYQKKLQQERNAQEARAMSEIFGSGSSGLSNIQAPMSGNRMTTNSGGFGSSFGSFLGDVGSNILNPIASLFSGARPFISQQSQGQPALPTLSTMGGQESQSSGVSQAFLPGFPNILAPIAKILRNPVGGGTTGLIGGIAGSLLGTPSGGMRITRKMKSQYRAVLNLAGGDYDQAAAMIGVSTDMFIMVLLKRFRNDGPVVTKAALRKTKTTVRRLKSMCDMYDSLRPTATRRKAPMRRASTTLISNK